MHKMITPKERTFYPELPATITSVENALPEPLNTLMNLNFHVKEFYQLHRLIKIKRNVRMNPSYKNYKMAGGRCRSPQATKRYPSIQLNLNDTIFFPFFFTFHFPLFPEFALIFRFPHLQVQQFFSFLG